MTQVTRVKVFANGLTCVVEPVPGVRSVSLNAMLPAGAATDPADAVGAATVLADWVMRGAGQRDSRTLTAELDRLGLQRSTSVGLLHARFNAVAVGRRLREALPLFADIFRRPMLIDEEFENARDLSLQALDGLDDDPRSLAMMALRQKHWPAPFDRNPMGVREQLQALTPDVLRDDFVSRFTPGGAIFAIAGDIDVDAIEAELEEHFGDWTGVARQPVVAADPEPGVHFIESKTEQTHIGIAWPSVAETDPDYYVARLVGEVLSGGTSGRLFAEIREKRGLCYSVGASYSALRGRASFLGYAGTAPERAQHTLDQFLHELRRLSEGITDDEIHRARIGIKSNLLMSNDSTGARAAMIGYDAYAFGRVRSVEEIIAAYDRVDARQATDFVRRRPPWPFTVVVIGPKPLEAQIQPT